MPTTLRRKLMIVMMVTSGVTLLITCGTFVGLDVLNFRKQMVRRLTTQAGIIAANSTAALAFENEADAVEVLSSLGTDPHIVAAGLYDPSGRPFASYHASPSAKEPLPERPEEQGHRFEHSRFVLFQRVTEDGATLGTLYLASDLGALAEQTRLHVFAAGLVLAGAIAVSFFLSIWMQRRISGPILSLATAARQVSEGRDYSIRAGKSTEDEIGLLTDDFNEMLRQIEQRDESVHRLNAELEQRVRERTADLEASVQEMESFSYSVSHDLRAPLRSIDGFSKALLDDYEERLDTTARDYLTRVRTATGNMATLIDDLLDLARTSRTEMRTEPVDLSALARRVADELRRTQPQREVAFAIEPNLKVEGDAHLLGVVLDNLLRNAWKFTSKHPTARIEIGRLETNDAAPFFVRDDGAGFDMAHADLLFKAFQRLHRRTDFEGTGVGLATVQRIIQRHRGRLWAEAEVERGATFYFTIGEDET